MGDITNPKRPRTQANERLDVVDTDGLATSPRDLLDAHSRAFEVQPRNVGSTTPTGLIVQGFGLTLNPTGPTDAKVRVQSPVGVALDSNGRLLIKENGVQVDLPLPAGNSQVYVYFVESGTDVTLRRAITVASPFSEGSAVIATRLKSDVAFVTIAGDQTSIVASAVVAGATTPLCFLGVANNTGGVVTMTGYDAVNAPNGAFATNRFASVQAAPTLPVANTSNGSIVTMHGLVAAALFMVGQAFWKGSKNFTPSAANNFGVFTSTTTGIDGLFDSQGELVFPPITRWRDFQQNVRALVDYSGYPGGQISIKDDHWFVNQQDVHLDPAIGFKTAGSAVVGTATPFGVVLSTSSDAWQVPVGSGFLFDTGAGGLSGNNIVVTSILVTLTSTNSANTLTAALTVVGGTSPQVSRTVTTGAGLTFDIMSTPTSGHGPMVIDANTRLFVTLSCAITGGTITVSNVRLLCTVPPPGWSRSLGTTVVLAAGDAVNFLDPVSGLNQRHVQLVTVGAASLNLGAAQLNSVPEVFVDNDLAHTMEFIMKTGVVDDAHHSAFFTVGVTTVNAHGWGIQYSVASSTHWFLTLADNSTFQQVDTGVVVAANTVYRFKVDFFGVNRNTGGHQRARVWINGTLVATVNSVGSITAAQAFISLTASCGLSSGPYDFRVGRLHRVWNHLASGDNI